MSRKRITLKDVAAAVGVHVSTVSRALDDKTRHLITPEVAARVLKASRALNYQPNAVAYSLKTNRTRTIGMVVPDITNPIFPPIIRGVEDGLAEAGYVAIVANTVSSVRREQSVMEMLRARGVDGLIVASVERRDPAIERLAEEGMAIVTVNRRVDDPAISSVVNDEDEGIRRVLTHLASLGHRRIANIAGPQGLSTGRERYEAFEAWRADLGLDVGPELVVFADSFNEPEGERCTEELLARTSGYTALVCSNDRLAIGALTGLERRGLACPEEISVTGYNDMPMVDRIRPPLTTVRIQQYKVGFAAAEILVDRLRGEGEAEPVHRIMPVELVVRGSTRALRQK